jgi:hypothetical protein
MTVTVTHTKVSAIPDGADTTVVRPSDWNASHTLVGLGTAAELDAGVANGVATLDSSGKVPSSQLSGVVTSVTGTAPVVSSGGATPAISMAAATASVNGYLTSSDWSTFNLKGSGTVTSVAALTLGTAGTDVSSSVATGTTTPVITFNLPTASATNRGALSSTDWSTFNNKQAAFGSQTANYVYAAPNGSAGSPTFRAIVPQDLGTGTPSSANFLRGDGTWAIPGKILQVVSVTKTNTASTTSQTWADISGLSVSITPSNSSNKILVLYNFYGGNDGGGGFVKLVRNSTDIAIGTAATGSQLNVTVGNYYNADLNTSVNMGGTFLDSPASTSSVTYKAQYRVGTSGGTFAINRNPSNADAPYTGIGVSTITLMEIAA